MSVSRAWRIITAALMVLLLTAPPAWAHDQPEGGNASYVMADWMFWTFVLFGGASFVGACAAWKLGYFRDLDDQRRVPLMIDEPDYYTPEWASEDDESDANPLAAPEVNDG